MDTQNATEKQFTSDADLIMWIDINQVLYAETLLSKWQREAVERLIPSLKWDASYISPAFRALVIHAHRAKLTDHGGVA